MAARSASAPTNLYVESGCQNPTTPQRLNAFALVTGYIEAACW
jgi:hypothetical protein